MPLQPPFRWKLLNKFGLARHHSFRTNKVISYSDFVAAMGGSPASTLPRFPCVTPAFDNTVLRCLVGSTILHMTTLEAYRHFLLTVLSN
jgi:hypothetical protein